MSNLIKLEMLSDWEQTTRFQQYNVQKIPVLSIDFDIVTFIFDLDLEQMALAKYKKYQTCSDWRDIENLSFCHFDLDLWPWYSTLT